MRGKAVQLKPSKVRPYSLTLGGPGAAWRPGVISLVNEARLPAGALVQARNLMQTQDGVWSTRWGSKNYGQALVGPITAAEEFVIYNDDGSTTQYYMVMDNGVIKYAKDGGAWTTIRRPAAAPTTSPSVAATTGSALGVGAYLYQVVFVAGGGQTLPGPSSSISTTSGNQAVNLTSIPLGGPGVTARKIYRTAVGGAAGTEKLVATIPNNTATTFTDTVPDGSLGAAVPTADTSTIPYTTLRQTRMLQYQNFMLLANGIDDFSYVNLKTFSIATFTGLPVPSTPSVALSSTLSAGQFNLYYQVTAISQVGETSASAAVVASVNISRANWYNPNATQVSTSSYYVTLSFPKVAGAIGYNIYCSDGISGVAYYLDSVGQPSGSGPVTYTDYGSAAINDFIQVPLSDTTSAPKFSWLALSDNRLWACGDPNNPQRVYWSSTNQEYPLAFSPYIGGGWVDVAPGSNERPHWVGQFRSGQGTPMTTILTSQPSGYGSTWHVQITTSSIGNTQVAVPSLVQSLSTFGTLSPFGVIQTNENVYFHSGIGGFFSTGSVPTLFNVLSTNEVSLLIRPDVRLLTLGALPSITGIEYDRKLWWSVPYANGKNNRVFIYDLEKNNWNPYAFDFGVDKFFRYTDNDGLLHLLALPTGGTSLIEINENYRTDNNMAFTCHLQTGLIHPSPDHIQFVNVAKVYYEFGEPEGPITMTASGTPMDTPLSQLQTNTELFGSNQGSNVGFSSFAFSARTFSYTADAPVVSNDLSTKKFQLINQILNNFQIEVESSSVAQWTLNTVTIAGQFVPMLDDSRWWTS